MKDLLDVLNKVLTEEIAVYRDLLSKMDEKTQILVKGDIEALDKFTIEENNIVSKLSKFENLRNKVVFNIQYRMGIKEEVDISYLLSLLDEEEGRELSKLREEFLKVLKELKEKNNLNSALIKDSLDYVNLNINLLTNRDEEVTYGNKNNYNQNTTSIFNQRA